MRSFPHKLFKQRKKQPLKGSFLLVWGWVMYLTLPFAILVMIVVLAELSANDLVGLVLFLLLGIYAFFMVPVAGRVILRGKRILSPGGLDTLQSTKSPPVLFLRSFEDDTLLDLTPKLWTLPMSPRLEIGLAQALKPLGPILTLGRPGEPEPLLGSARLYVEDANWQKAILYFLESAKAVVIVVRQSRSLDWEIQTALKKVPRERLLFFFPYQVPASISKSYWRLNFFRSPFISLRMKKTLSAMNENRENRYRSFRQDYEKLIGSLPGRLGDSRFLTFDRNGKPKLLARRKASFYVRVFLLGFVSAFNIPFKKEIGPFIRNLG